MLKTQNGRVHLTGRDEVIFSTVLFLMNLFLDEKNATRNDVNRAIHYFRDQGMPLDEWLFNHILARWDTRLAWGTPARIVWFPLDQRNPAGGESVICRARRREMWKRMCEAVGCRTVVSAPPWLRNTPEFGGDLPSGDAMLTVMADFCGAELLDRLGEWTEPEPDVISQNDRSRTSKSDDRFEAIFSKLRAYPEIEVGFRPRKCLNLDSS
jgi:hypothetical protein